MPSLDTRYMILFLLLQAVEFSTLTSIVFPAGMALVSITAVIVTTRSGVASLKEQSQIIIDSIKDQLKHLAGSVDTLTLSTNKLTLEVALRDERAISMTNRIDKLEDDMKTARANLH